MRSCSLLKDPPNLHARALLTESKDYEFPNGFVCHGTMWYTSRQHLSITLQRNDRDPHGLASNEETLSKIKIRHEQNIPVYGMCGGS